MLTFEFPDAERASAFLRAATLHVAGKCSHRVVDLAEPTDDDPSVARAARDYLMLLARKHGASEAPTDRLQAAQAALENTSLCVARAANEIRLHGFATVLGERMALIHPDDWSDLQEAISEWKAAGEEFQNALLASTQPVG